MKKELKIGEVFQCGPVKLKVKENSGLCDGCFFDNGLMCTQTVTESEDIGSCIYSEREDKTNVIFVEIED